MSDGNVERFARLVVEISQMVAIHELSQMKLHVRATNLLGIMEVEEITQTADLLRILIDRSKITQSNLGLLVELLHIVKRNDLVRKILLYAGLSHVSTSADVGSSLIIPGHRENVKDDSGCIKVQNDCDSEDSGELPSSQMSVDDERDLVDFPLSGRSITDEEKVRRDECDIQNSQMSIDDDHAVDLSDLISLSGTSITDEQKTRCI